MVYIFFWILFSFHCENGKYILSFHPRGLYKSFEKLFGYLSAYQSIACKRKYFMYLDNVPPIGFIFLIFLIK